MLVELFFAVGMATYAISMLYSSWKGSPYVPTKKKELINFLKEIKINKGDYFIELGSGDGRVVREAVKIYGVKGLGVDINPLLNVWARLMAKKNGLKNISFTTQNIFDTDLSQADIVYIFLMPKLIESIKPKLKKEIKKKAVVISHGFKIQGWEKYNFKTISHKPFPTYFYSMSNLAK